MAVVDVAERTTPMAFQAVVVVPPWEEVRVLFPTMTSSQHVIVVDGQSPPGSDVAGHMLVREPTRVTSLGEPALAHVDPRHIVFAAQEKGSMSFLLIGVEMADYGAVLQLIERTLEVLLSETRWELTILLVIEGFAQLGGDGGLEASPGRGGLGVLQVSGDHCLNVGFVLGGSERGQRRKYALVCDCYQGDPLRCKTDKVGHVRLHQIVFGAEEIGGGHQGEEVPQPTVILMYSPESVDDGSCEGRAAARLHSPK